MIDLTNYLKIQKPTKTRTIITCYVRLDKKSMLEALMHEQIFINGKYYKVPKITLFECLINKRFGETRLDLQEIG